YYHIDISQRYLRSLGFTNVVDFSIRVDPHGLNGADNSHYVPSGPRLAFGDGCVDDAEEADVIVHEYGHAIQDDQSPNWLNSGEMGALGEGFGDYWSEAYSDRMGFTFNRGKVFDWDAGGLNNGSPCWSGRRVDTAKTYPEDVSGSIHQTGEIWSGALWDLREAIGGEAADSVIIESHFFVEPSGSFGFEDAGLALIQADSALTNGRYEAAIRSVLIARGILEGSLLAPALSEAAAPLTVSQGDSLALAIRAVGTNPVSRVEVVYGMPASSQTFSLTETATDIWSGTLGFALVTDTLRYYYRAVDAAGNVALEPPGAPAQVFATAVLPDAVAPTVTHDAIGDRLDSQFPLTISAVISDNLSLNEDSLFAEYTFEPAKGGSAPAGTFALTATGDAGTFAGIWPDLGDRGGRYEYRIVAVDNSIEPNRTTSPSSGVYEFEVTTDSVAPVIVHEAIAEREAGLEDIPVSAIIRDQGNLIPDSVLVEFTFTGTSVTTGVIVMTAENDSSFSAVLPGGLTKVGTYSYRLTALDAAFVPNRSRFPADGSFLTFDIVPGGSELRLIGPNPFGESVAFSVFLEEASEISLEIYDIAGRRVAEVASGNRSGAQVFSWDGRNDAGEEAGPGIYLYRFERGGREESGRIVRLR
ncbi:MAG: T9SS type A sorting domain-containing protein, partial [Gemmatimonadetes bacterium]|nr:T9SS type A sorting domain-containing protein [Gemmatimonadota bacterium]